jgi:hypothetical protein
VNDRLTVVVLTNLADAKLGRIAAGVADIYLRDSGRTKP